MAEKLKVELQDDKGNIYYLHTDASVVFCEDGSTVQSKLNGMVKKSDIIQNATTAATDKVVSGAVAKNLQDQISEQNTNMLKVVTQHELITCTANTPRTYIFPEVPGAIISFPMAGLPGVIVTRDFTVSGSVTVLSPVSQDVGVILVTLKK